MFHRAATYPVYVNRPEGEDPATETVAEISSVTPDGNTLIYTDAASKRIGFLDISDPSAPQGLGTLSLATLGDEDDQPTSVAVVGEYALVVIDTSASFTDPGGRVDVVRISDRSLVRSLDLGGQPDSIAVSGDQRYAAIAIENQRDEDVQDGDLPQLPSGFVQILDILDPAAPQGWATRKVALTNGDGTALPILAGLAEPTDLEPEYVSINSANKVALTLQENNGVAIIDLATGAVDSAFSTGMATVSGIDTMKDGVIEQNGTIADVPREPDAVGWIDNRYIATANEGDWLGGTRGWTVFDTTTGSVAWDAGNSFEKLAIQYGQYNEDRAGKKGTEPEGIAIATFDGIRYAFVGSERSNFVAVYTIADPTSPQFVQLMPTTNGPEGILPIPGRNMLAVSSEVDDASVLVRSTVSLFVLDAGPDSQPSLLSDSVDGDPIAWGALGALSADPADPTSLFSVTDSFYADTRILRIDTAVTPAVIRAAIPVTAGGEQASYDAEGIFARPQGGFWLANEGATGEANALVLLNDSGETQASIALPASISRSLSKWGFEGVTAITDDAGEHVWVAVQRALSSDPADIARLGRYDVEAETWTWFGYRLEAANAPGDWIGLSEIVAIDADSLAVIERDKRNGPDAAIKAIYAVDIPATGGLISTDAPAPEAVATTDTVEAADGRLTVLPKTLVHDVLPNLRATNGWTPEKLEGLTIGGDGTVYAITDNDGTANAEANGETVFLRLGSAAAMFADFLPAAPVDPTPSSTAGSSATTPVSPAAPVPAAGPRLAATGSSDAWTAVAGGSLVLIGAAALIAVRHRTAG